MATLYLTMIMAAAATKIPAAANAAGIPAIAL
jgi:hypothetical protein